MSTLGTPRIPTIGDQPKARGAGQPPRKYAWHEWARGYLALVLLSPVWLTCWFLANVVRKLPDSATRKLLLWHIRKTGERDRDVRIPGDPSIRAYMLRWWHIMRNAYFNCYLHQIYRSDSDVALHDHPWWNFSIVLEGGYWEHRIKEGGIHVKTWYGPGSMQFRWKGALAHRLELQSFDPESDGVPWRELPAATIFITGPVLRRWGFHHELGWVDAYDWDEFCRARGIGGDKMSGYAEQVAKPRTTK